MTHTPPDPVADLVIRQLDEARVELTRADAKATTLFAVTGLGVSAVLAGVISGNWDPTDLSLVREIVWWMACSLAVSAITALGAAVFPRTGGSPEVGRARYFKEIAVLKTEDEVRNALAYEAGNTAGTLDRNINQLHRVSKIVNTKYELVRWALRLYGAGAFAGITAVLI